MKNTKKRILNTVILLTVISFAVNAQTNVSGGIFANTTWTLANSPYIVVDTVVVFPNVTLTIEPGVIVKFENNKRLEIRQAQLIAIGTATDSITFTKNSGIWSSVLINGGNYVSSFNYCNFYYASMGGIIDGGNNTTIRHSNFRYNTTGVNGYTSGGNNRIIDSCNFSNNAIGINASDNNCIVSNSVFRQNTGLCALFAGVNSEVKNCIINSNQGGIQGGSDNTISNCTIDSNVAEGVILSAWSDSIINCEIKYNGIGIHKAIYLYTGNVITQNTIENNNIGILLESNGVSIHCNKICNNTNYDLQSDMPYNINVAYNNWCTPDSASTATVIYDAYDNVSLGIVSFMPLDTSMCYLTGSNCSAYFNLYADTIPHNWIAVNMSTGYPPLSYSWDWGDGSFPPDTLANPSHIYNNAGYYTICLTITDGTGCTSTYCDSSVYLYKSSSAVSMVTVNVILPTGVTYHEPTSNLFNIFPNPVNETLTITKNNDALAEFILHDVTGRKLLRKEFTNTAILNTEQLTKGVYIYEVRSKNGVIKKGKIVKD